jgi:hypothetical protein
MISFSLLASSFPAAAVVVVVAVVLLGAVVAGFGVVVEVEVVDGLEAFFDLCFLAGLPRCTMCFPVALLTIPL